MTAMMIKAVVGTKVSTPSSCASPRYATYDQSSSRLNRPCRSNVSTRNINEIKKVPTIPTVPTFCEDYHTRMECIGIER